MFPSQGVFQTCNSSLTEYGVLSFEYGFATYKPDTLVIWEAQFGDFSNVGQTSIDCYICSGEAKWGSQCGMILNLPHGNEGLYVLL